MINGVMHIVAAVLFAVISVHEGMNLIWIGIAGVYLVTGIINLVAHALRIRKIEKAAKKAEQEKQKAAEKAAEKTAENSAEKEEAEVTAAGG